MLRVCLMSSSWSCGFLQLCPVPIVYFLKLLWVKYIPIFIFIGSCHVAELFSYCICSLFFYLKTVFQILYLYPQSSWAPTFLLFMVPFPLFLCILGSFLKSILNTSDAVLCLWYFKFTFTASIFSVASSSTYNFSFWLGCFLLFAVFFMCPTPI